MVATVPAKPTKAKGTSPIRAAQPAAHGRSPPTTAFRGNASSVRMAVQVTAPSQPRNGCERGRDGGEQEDLHRAAREPLPGAGRLPVSGSAHGTVTRMLPVAITSRPARAVIYLTLKKSGRTKPTSFLG